VKKPSSRIVVPRSAVLSDQLGNYVLVVNGKDKVVRQNVTLASSGQAQAVIASGVSSGAKIIVNGIQKVHPGVKVKPTTVQNEATASDQAGAGQSGQSGHGQSGQG
jgi:membrane fusion protein (multidrug efflux system)